MNPLAASIVSLLFASAAVAQTTGQDPQSQFYPAPPPEQAPKVEQGAPIQGLTSPLLAHEQKIIATKFSVDELYEDARKALGALAC